MNKPVLKKIWHLNLKCSKRRKNGSFHSVYKVKKMFFLVHCCQVFISKSTLEGMYRSLAKQDTLVTDIISDILRVNETPRSSCKWQIHKNLF